MMIDREIDRAIDSEIDVRSTRSDDGEKRQPPFCKTALRSCKFVRRRRRRQDHAHALAFPHALARPAALASPLLPSAATPALALVFLSSCSHLITTKFDIVPEVVEFDIVH